ncbi:kelch repeat and BTB domain-containing protein 8-like [Branchiostoma floridae]|uniref:Kelch repeat and BTB domain-containing protein 8-like n=1 Tax=Branchiostoma floridae TaxID=7739 RepID=A0A9J7KPS1_BRAFL|nr:kelch repeat and BTB domain-containing protein 8-like [Branchiostoma floridae]
MNIINKKYPNTFFRELNDLRKRAELTDVVLEVERTSFPCHRAVLASCSPYFRGMFTSGYAEAKQERVSIQKVTKEAMATILGYAYTGCLRTAPDQVQAVMSAARLLQVDFVYQKAAEYMKDHLDVFNCTDVLMYTDMLGDLPLQEVSGRFIASKFNQVVLQSSFLQLSLPLLQRVLNRDDLMANSEEVIVEAAFRWIDFKQEERLQHLPDICKSLRRTFISSDKLVELESKCQSTNSELVYSDSTTQRVGMTRTEMQIAVLREASTEFPLYTRCFDLSRGTRYTMNMPANLECFTMIGTDEGELYLAGGVIIEAGGTCTATNKWGERKFFQYNHLLNTWEPRCDMIGNRIRCSLVCLDGYIYAIGDGRTNRTAERYDPSRDQWICIPTIPYPMPRAHSRMFSSVYCAVALDDSIYVMGREGCYCFSTADNKWKKTADMLEAPGNPQAVTYRGRIYCVDTEFPEYVQMYNPEDGVWAHSDKAKTFSCTGLALMPHGGSLYLLTVNNPEHPYEQHLKRHDIYQYQPETDTWLKPESPDIVVTSLKRWFEAHILEDWLMVKMIPTSLVDVTSNDGRRLGSPDGEDSDN